MPYRECAACGRMKGVMGFEMIGECAEEHCDLALELDREKLASMRPNPKPSGPPTLTLPPGGYSVMVERTNEGMISIRDADTGDKTIIWLEIGQSCYLNLQRPQTDPLSVFLNMVRSLYNIDKDRLPELTVDPNGNRYHHSYWEAFRDNPARFFSSTDRRTAEAIFREVMKRQHPQPTKRPRDPSKPKFFPEE